MTRSSVLALFLAACSTCTDHGQPVSGPLADDVRGGPRGRDDDVFTYATLEEPRTPAPRAEAIEPMEELVYDESVPEVDAQDEAGIDALVRDASYEAASYLPSRPELREPVANALERCAREAAEDSTWCLLQLASVDWGRAREVARTSRPVADDSHDAELRSLLNEHSDASELTKDLVASGMIERAPREVCLSVEEALIAAGVGFHFDVETSTFPNRHDRLLARLSALAPDALPGVTFSETPPAEPGAATGHAGRYVLHASSGGRHYSTPAEDLGDWYDLEATLGLLNALARERRSPTRWAALPTGDQTAIVVAAPEPAWRRAMAAGLVDLGSPDAARADGVAAEAAVRELLERNLGGN